MNGARKINPIMLAAIVVVLLGGALFLLLPIFVGGGLPTAKGYPVAKEDHISTWTWDGVYRDGAEKEDLVTKDIARLKGELGKGVISDYDLYVGLSSQYELLGEGKTAYQYLSKAIELDPKRALAYMNMGHLMSQMGAFQTAHTAYDAAVAAEPNNPIYASARQNFLIQRAPSP